MFISEMKILQKLIENKVNNALFAVIILAIFLRVFNLSSVPPSASLDEVSIGYNAYSILKTGADEYGTKFPILLRSYDDWRPALYVYLVIPFIQFFGLTVEAVRLPSVSLSVLTVLATYFLVRKLFPKNQNIALFAAGFLAISPWHIYISRLGHEANAGLAFFIFGLTFFFRKSYFSLLFFALSLISYQSEKIFLPFFTLGLFLIFRKVILEKKKEFFFAGLISLIILLPFIKATLEPNALVRFRGTSIFSASTHRYIEESLLLSDAVRNNDFLKQMFYNRRVVSLKIFFEAYISHFNPQWLFLNLYEDRHKVPNMGLFYLWEAPLIFIGLIFLLFQKSHRKVKILLSLWILLAPMPAALTTDAPHALRIYQMLPMPQILSAIGITQMYFLVKKYQILSSKYYISKILLFLPISILIGSLIYFYNQYFVIFPKTQSLSFQYALSKAISYVLENEKSYNKIIFSNKENLSQSYMFFLFFSKYNPYSYQKDGGTKSGGFAQTHSFGKYEFRPIRWKNEEKKNTIYIGNINEFPLRAKVLKTMDHLNGEPAIKIIEKN